MADGLEDEDLPSFVTELGLPGLFDVHVHFMPPRIMQAVWSYFDSAGPLVGREWPIYYRGSEEQRLDRLRTMSVRHFSALSYAHKPGVATFMNDWNREFAGRVPESLWSGTFFPESGSGEYVGRLVDDGVQVFKAHMQVGEYAADDPLLDGVWDVLNQSMTPVVMHAGSGPVPGKYTGPESVSRTLERFPDLTLIIAHLGAPEYHEFMDLAGRYPNVYLDTTMAFVDFWGRDDSAAVTPRLLDLQPKILLGTDFPNIPYQYAHQVEVLQRLNLGDDWMRDVLWNNSARLFGVEREQPIP